MRHSRASPRTPSAKETLRAWAGVPTPRRADRGVASVSVTGGSTASKPPLNTSAAATSGCRCRPMAAAAAPTARRARPVSVARGDRIPGARPPQSAVATRAGPSSCGRTCTSHCGRAASSPGSNRRSRLGVRADRRDVEPGRALSVPLRPWYSGRSHRAYRCAHGIHTCSSLMHAYDNLHRQHQVRVIQSKHQSKHV